MLQRNPRRVLHRAQAHAAAWWQRGPTRLRQRRQLLVCTLPAATVLLALAAEITRTMLAGQAALTDYNRHDLDALRADVATLSQFNIVDPAQVSFIAADLAVLEGRLEDAEHHFTAALAHDGGPASCPVRVNLELLRETRGDLAAATSHTAQAEQFYTTALQMISAAPPGCFTDNTDPNPDRREIRANAAARVTDKINTLHMPAPPPAPVQTLTPQPPPTSLTPTTVPPPPPPGATSTPTPPPPPPPTPGGTTPAIGPTPGAAGPGPLNDVTPDRLPVSGTGPAPAHRLAPGDPLERLHTTLADADATGASGEPST
ncbi:hypothetical protein [Mycobacterium sp.]|uniref:hypothetical protein n=1 Tax=Mycobacterium sp. TaxID=1785 RepID=UPI000CB8DAA6|nr:hypothetical protein [Mycobacterium sp.]PJE02823.1 MAG: hypothetical protein CK428_29510 [Mycobacterium sp.]